MISAIWYGLPLVGLVWCAVLAFVSGNEFRRWWRRNTVSLDHAALFVTALVAAGFCIAFMRWIYTARAMFN